MQATLELNGQSMICDLIYPNIEHPMSVPGPLGTMHVQQRGKAPL